MGLDRSYVSRIMRIALLAPDIVEAIVDGREPSGLSLERLVKGIPIHWPEQWQKLDSDPDFLTNRLHDRVIEYIQPLQEST